MKRNLLTVLFMTLPVVLLLLAVPGRRSEETHKCRFALCPYTGVKVDDRREAIIEYTQTEDTDAFYIDDLHFLNPNAGYDELEALLFSSGYSERIYRENHITDSLNNRYEHN